MEKEHEFKEGVLYIHFEDELSLLLEPTKYHNDDFVGINRASLFKEGEDIFTLSKKDKNFDFNESDIQKQFLSYLKRGIDYAKTKFISYLNGEIKDEDWEENYNDLYVITQLAENNLINKLKI